MSRTRRRPPVRVPGGRAAAALALALLLAGCSGEQASPVASATAAPTAPPSLPAQVAPTEESCPPGGDEPSWPAEVPSDLPVPPTTVLAGTERSNGLLLVRFSTSQSIREGVLFLTENLQPAGYTIGRGDAEAIEADVPFSRGELRGLMKMVAQAPCSTSWILALQDGAAPAGGTPLLPPTTTTSPSPLPFG